MLLIPHRPADATMLGEEKLQREAQETASPYANLKVEGTVSERVEAGG